MFFSAAVFSFSACVEYSKELQAQLCGSRAARLMAALSFIYAILRLKTKEHIQVKKTPLLLLLLLLTSCAGVQQTLEQDVFYKRDISIYLNGNQYEGVTTAPYSKSYTLTLEPKGEFDLMLIRTCHREISVEKQNKGWFGSKKNQFSYEYIPVVGLEDSRECPVRVEAYQSSKNQHGWALVEFENPKFTLPYSINCNGVYYSARGVFACQSKRESVQRLKFNEPVRFALPAEGCSPAIKVGDFYEIKVSSGECPYAFDTRDGKVGRLLMVGFSGVLVRSEQ